MDIDVVMECTGLFTSKENASLHLQAGAKQVSEDDMLEALMFGHEEIKRLVAFQKEIVAAAGKEKREVSLFKIPEDLEKAGLDFAIKQINDLLANGVNGIHIYTMNKPYVARTVLKGITR